MKMYTCIATCGECGAELNRAEHVPESEQLMVCMSAPLNCLCEIPEHNTFSDCNLGVKLEWVEETAASEAVADSGHAC